MKKLLIVMITLLLLTSCSGQQQTFVNPDFPCPTENIVEQGQGYPIPVKQSEPGMGVKSVAELKEFCTRMKERFTVSGMTKTEAETIYKILSARSGENFPQFHNGCYGMPICDEEPFEMTKQVMIKKISASEYELFYYYIGCGINYFHMKVYIDQGVIQDYQNIEYWSERYPC
jgi:hypothetical protein